MGSSHVHRQVCVLGDGGSVQLVSELEEDVLGLAWLSPSVLLAASASAVHVLDTDEGGAEACCLEGKDFVCFSLALAAPLLAVGTAEPKV